MTKKYRISAVLKDFIQLQVLKTRPEVMAEELEEELSEIEKVIAAQKKVGSYDVEQICMAMIE